ncbi:hypothetical protein S245_030584 [Arachis hypogaea]
MWNDGHGTRFLRYSALCSAMSVVAKLASNDSANFAAARDVIASLAQKLNGQRGNTVAHESVRRQQDVMKEPSIARTKGAPKHGREAASSTQDAPGGKRRCCTSCGHPGHTKRTCLSQRDISHIGLRQGISCSRGNSSSGDPTGNRNRPACSENANGKASYANTSENRF